MPEPIKLTLAQVKEAGLKALNEGRLSAQGPTPACRYRDKSGRPCVIGAALTDEQAERCDDSYNDTLRSLFEDGIIDVPLADIGGMVELQNAHDLVVWGQAPLAELRALLEAA